jgi:hypothetical protein
MNHVESQTEKETKQLYEFDPKLRMSPQDFNQFANGIQSIFKPTKALQRALDIASKVHRTEVI